MGKRGPSREEPGEPSTVPPRLLLVAVAVLSAVLRELRDAIAVLSRGDAGRFSSLGG